MGKVNLSGKLMNVPEYYLKSFFQVQVFFSKFEVSHIQWIKLRT